MYTDDAKMVWNGNAMEGRDTIATFLNSLPDSEHNLKALDAQPINGAFLKSLTFGPIDRFI